MKNKIKHRLLLIVIFAIFSMGFDKNPSNRKDIHLISSNTLSNFKNIETVHDPNLLIGEWSQTGTPMIIKITGVLETGKLEVVVYYSNSSHKFEIEKANWQKSGTLLTVYIEFQDPEYPGSNFKLNYIPERDVLAGGYYDATEGMKDPVEFIRIK